MLYKDDETLPASAPPPAPLRLGEFRVERELGRGGMGVVYLAEQERLDRKVALKVLALAAAPTAVAAERFQREAALVGKLEHENIVRVYATGQEQGCLYYAMELVEGESLRDRIARGALPPREAAEIGRAVARALDCAHRAGIVHRDVKPANVLLDRSGVPRLADFGLAHGEDSKSLTISGDVLGTPAYMSPEQASADGNVDARADVYSLGAVLYEAITGAPPCGLQRDVFAQLQAVRLINPVSPARLNARIPRDLDVIVMRCLEKEPARRYPTARELAEDLDRFLRGEAILARPPSIAWRVRRFARRHRAAAGSSAMLAVVLSGVAAFWATRPGHLTLHVQPPDAEVRIDGGNPLRDVARLPLAPGSHIVRVSRDGYVPAEFPYVVQRAESAVVPVNLERVRERVRIATDPLDCTVRFQPSAGERFRRLSDVDESIPTDRYEVVVEKEGWWRERIVLDLRSGEPADLRVTMSSACLWSKRFPQPTTPLAAPIEPGGPPVIAVACESGEVEFFRGLDGASLGKSSTTGQLAEPLLVDIEPDGTPELLTIDPAGGARLVRLGSGAEVWTQHAPLVGRVDLWPDLFLGVANSPSELRLAYQDGIEIVDVRSGGSLGQFAPERQTFRVILSDEGRRYAALGESVLSVMEGKDVERERIETPPVAYRSLFLSSIDLDGDGGREVVARCADGSIHAYATDPLRRLWRTQPTSHPPGQCAVGALREGERPCLVALVADRLVQVFEADGRARASWALPAAPLGAIALADMDADGTRDLVFAAPGGLHVVDLSAGRPIAEVPFERPPSGRFAIADVDGDGLLDAVVSLTDGTLQVVPGRKILWSWSTGHSIRRTPALLDLTGDGAPDVVFCSLDGHAYALDGRTGGLLWKAPLGGQAATTPAALGCDFVMSAWGGRAVRVSGRTGAEVWRYQPIVEGWNVNFHASPIVADVDGDGRIEVVLADWRSDPLERKAPSGAVHCLDAENGGVKWVKELFAPFVSTPAFAGPSEVVVGDTEGNLVCLRGDGSVRWREAHGGPFRVDPSITPEGSLALIVSTTGEVLETRSGETGSKPLVGFPRALLVAWGTVAGRPIRIVGARKDVAAIDPVSGKEVWRFEARGEILASPLAADVERDGTSEVFVADQGGHVSCLEGATGDVRWTWSSGSPIEAAPIAADIDGDGRVEAIVATSDGRVVVLNTRGRRWSGEWLTPWGDRFRTCAPDSVGATLSK